MLLLGFNHSVQDLESTEVTESLRLPKPPASFSMSWSRPVRGTELLGNSSPYLKESW